MAIACFGRPEAGANRKPAMDTPGGAPFYRANLEKIGAGEGIRTLDPDLGKVVLYP